MDAAFPPPVPRPIPGDISVFFLFQTSFSRGIFRESPGGETPPCAGGNSRESGAFPTLFSQGFLHFSPFSRGGFHARCPQGWDGNSLLLQPFLSTTNISIYSNICHLKAAHPCGGPRKATVNRESHLVSIIELFSLFFYFFFPKSSIPIDTSLFQPPHPCTPGLPPLTWNKF